MHNRAHRLRGFRLANREAAQDPPQAVRIPLALIKAKLGVSDVRDAYPLCRGQIERDREWLPLEGRLSGKDAKRPGVHLSYMRREVLIRKAEGKRAATIGRGLEMAVNTFHVHLRKVRTTLGVGSDRAAVEKAARYGLTQLD